MIKLIKWKLYKKKTTNPYDAIVAVAYLFPTCSTLILTFCPTFAFLTNTANPCTLAIPSPIRLFDIVVVFNTIVYAKMLVR